MRVLSLPTLGFAVTITTVGTYLPVVLADVTTSTAVIGALIAIEGILALFLPTLVGAYSDHTDTRLGGRLPFVLVGTPVVILALAALGLVGGLVSALVAVLVFFTGYFIAYEPYRALYPDLVADDAAARAQSAQAVARGIGTAAALLGGGLLLAIAQPVPFAAAAGVLLVVAALFVWGLARADDIHDAPRPTPAPGSGSGGAREAFGALRQVVAGHRELRVYFVANALWEGALGAIRTFVVLWLTVGLGFGLTATAGIIGAAGVFVLAGAAVAGRLGDRYGTEAVLRVSAITYGAPMVAPFLSTETWLLLAMTPVVTFSAGVMMALPYALLIPMMPDDQHGLLTGFYSMSRGVGVMVGPVLAGVAIGVQEALGAPVGTSGYSAMWLVAGALLLASVPLLRPKGALSVAAARSR